MTLLDHASTSTAGRSAAPRDSARTTPLGGSYVTTIRTGSGHRRAEGTYVTTHRGAPVTRGGYVSTATALRLSGGFYTFSG